VGRLETYEKIKEERELKNCTFHPIVKRTKSRDNKEATARENSASKVSQFERLYKENIESKNFARIEEEKA